MVTPIRLYSKSSVERDWKCPRSLYYAYEFGGRGIQTEAKGLELFLGTAVHDGLALLAEQQLANQVNIDEISAAAFEQVYRPLHDQAIDETRSGGLNQEKEDFALEQATLVEGLLRGFHKHVWPALMRDYTIWLVEKPMVYRHGPESAPLGMMVKADIVLASRYDGAKWYLEYKTTSSKKPEWIESWQTAIQVHSSVKAIEQSTGEAPAGVIIQGLYKGYESYGKQSSPFCYAYVKAGQPPFTQDQVSYEYRSGWRRTPVWQLPGGIKAWVASMPAEILANQFPQTPPIFVDDDLISAFFLQQEKRQSDIEYAKHEMAQVWCDDRDEIMARFFPQRFDQCRPAWGYECPYRRLCHGSQIDPFANGYVWRDIEHLEPFMEALKETTCDDGSVTT